jgi:serine/threonine protein kinase
MARILVVDDDAAVLDHARLCLAGDGHRVETAADGEEGWNLAAAGTVELVFTDVYMPRLDGFGLAARLRDRDGPRAAPVVFLSNLEDRANYRRAMGLRAADFLIKPVACETMRRTARERLAAAAREAPQPAIGVSGYRILRQLGAGASGNVHLALHERTGLQCAIKTIQLPDDADEQRFVIERFQGECTILEAIVDTGIARVYDHGVADDCLYIALEYLPGGDLARELEAPMPPAKALDQAIQVARALACLHERGVVHRDVKPANLLRRADGTLALVDFGIARREHHHLTTHGRLLGTPTYMSPEQFRCERIDPRSDVYSLGCLFYQMLTGKRAFSAETLPALFGAHSAGPRPRLPAGLEHIQPVLDRMLARDRDARLPDGRAVAEALEGLREFLRRRQARDDAFSNPDLPL